MPKIAVSGKGGVGKTMFASTLAYVLAEEGRTVYAIDADPDPTLAQALGFPPEVAAQVVPIVAMADLIEERTGAKPGEYGTYFRLNPRVDDIPARFSVAYRGIHLMQMGSVRGAGMGCVCPENTMLKALVTHLLLREKETVVMDMVAGLEHLGRGTAGAVDVMFVLVEPGKRSIDVAHDIMRLAGGLGIPHVWVVANKVRSEQDLAFIRSHEPGEALAGWLPYDERVVEADMRGQAVYDTAPDVVARVRTMAHDTSLLPAQP
jgi:CO dehydrogenase maturation factor